jgi:hypothetical protein
MAAAGFTVPVPAGAGLKPAPTQNAFIFGVAQIGPEPLACTGWVYGEFARNFLLIIF